MQHYLKKSFLAFIFTFLSIVTVSAAKPCQSSVSDQKLHEWAVQSHREFWTMVGQMAGYEGRNEAGYQYVRSPSSYGLNYVYIAKGYKDSDAIINKMKDRPFTIFFEADDDEHLFKYITHLKESDDYVTMGMDLQQLDMKYSFKPGVKVWKVTTDAEFEQWLTVTASRRANGSSVREYFKNFKPSQNNQSVSFYLGAINGKVVGTGLIFFSNDFASLYWIGVHPDHRRHGLGSALSYEPLKEALRRGYRWSVLQAQPLGVPVYPKLGFKKVGILKVFYYLPPKY